MMRDEKDKEKIKIKIKKKKINEKSKFLNCKF